MNGYSSPYETASSLDQVNNVKWKEIAQSRLCKDCKIIVSYAGSIYYINATAPNLLPQSIRIIKVSIEIFMVECSGLVQLQRRCQHSMNYCRRLHLLAWDKVREREKTPVNYWMIMLLSDLHGKSGDRNKRRNRKTIIFLLTINPVCQGMAFYFPCLQNICSAQICFISDFIRVSRGIQKAFRC